MVFPVAGEGAHIHQACRPDGLGTLATGHGKGLPHRAGFHLADLDGLHIDQRKQGAQQPQACGRVIGHHPCRVGFAVHGPNIDLVGLQDQVADGENKVVGADHHAAAASNLAQGAGRGRAFDGAGGDLHHRRLGLAQGGGCHGCALAGLRH